MWQYPKVSNPASAAMKITYITWCRVPKVLKKAKCGATELVEIARILQLVFLSRSPQLLSATKKLLHFSTWKIPGLLGGSSQDSRIGLWDPFQIAKLYTLW